MFIYIFLSVCFDNIAVLLYSGNMKKQLQNIICNAGLSEKGAFVYLALLELGGAFPSRIAKHTKLKRSTVYEVLDNLAIKGLVSELQKHNKYFYSVEHPKRLINFSQRSITRAEENNQKLKELLPDLEGLYIGATSKPKVSYFEGADGVMEIYDDHVATNIKYEMLGFVNVSEIMKFLPQKKYRDYVRVKERMGVASRGIIPDTKEDRAYKNTAYKGIKKKILPEVRYIPKEEFPWKGDITIYGTNKISIISFDEQRVSGIVIESNTIYQMMRMVFELAWKGAAQ